MHSGQEILDMIARSCVCGVHEGLVVYENREIVYMKDKGRGGWDEQARLRS